jgi:WD40-like Beta Propeller Repeat
MTNPSPQRDVVRARLGALRPLVSLSSLLLAFGASGCTEKEPPEFTYYSDRIAPIVEVGCAVQTTGCHVATEQQAAVGNLDLTSYDALMRRRDALPAAGPYSVGQLMLKGGTAIEIPVQTFDPPRGAPASQRFVAVTTDVRHAGGTPLKLGSDGYAKLKSWITQGYQRNGEVFETQSVSLGECTSGAGAHLGFDPGKAPDAESFGAFVRDVQPILRDRCAGGNCHGSKQADFYLSCGDNEAERRWNYFVAVAHADLSASLSEILRRPLSKQRGGTFHEGGTIFLTTEDPDYMALRTWVENLVKTKPELVDYEPADEGLRFFGNYVQPVLVKKGCMFQNCHSPSMFHDLRLRGGSQGTFSRIAFDRNYEIARSMLALESEHPEDSRIIAKNLYPADRGGHGVAHRGGPLFEDFGESSANPSLCAGLDVTTAPLASVPAYCVLSQWHALERERALASGALSDPSELALVWVSRPLDVGDPRDFDTYRPGADLRRALLTLDAQGMPSVAASTSLLAGCGLSRDSADVRGPAVSWDGKKLAFAARSAASAPLRIFEANADGSGCAEKRGVAAARAEQNGILTHDFDPSYAPDGRLVFASTRGNVGGSGFSYQGPQRTPSQLAPNANIYVFDPAKSAVRQLSFLLNQELAPSFMGDGRLMYTTEKRAPEFFQLAGRRQNLDGSDYHPLFAQRKSVGFELATEVLELPNRNFALIAAKAGARDGAGTLAIINRSVGPDQDDRDPNDAFYLHSLSFPAPGAFDRGVGAYRSPAALPGPFLVLSCDPAATDLKRGGFDFDLCALNPTGGAPIHIAGEAGRADVEAVAVYARENRGVFSARSDEPNGATYIDADDEDAEVHILDAPLLATLLFDNRRVGRPIDARAGGFDVLESLPPDPNAKSFRDVAAADVVNDDYGQVFVRHEELGHLGLYDDGSAKMRVPGGHPLVLRVTDDHGRTLSFEDGGPFSGDMVQREEMQFYPGEHSRQSFRRPLFNGLCAGCHGSITGAELDIAVKIDVLTSASLTDARGAAATDLR